MASTRIPVLDFHGNGSVVCLEGIKPQATSRKRATNCRATIRPLTEAPSAKLQATSAKRQALPESWATNQRSL
jgi:hypothetical protein